MLYENNSKYGMIETQTPTKVQATPEYLPRFDRANINGIFTLWKTLLHHKKQSTVRPTENVRFAE